MVALPVKPPHPALRTLVGDVIDFRTKKLVHSPDLLADQQMEQGLPIMGGAGRAEPNPVIAGRLRADDVARIRSALNNPNMKGMVEQIWKTLTLTERAALDKALSDPAKMTPYERAVAKQQEGRKKPYLVEGE